MKRSQTSAPLRLALPKGRMEKGVLKLLDDAGIQIRAASRTYRPALSHPDLEAKLLNPRNIVEMLQSGSRDIGFTGQDWVAEKEDGLIQLLETSLDPVKVVAAAPEEFLVNGSLPSGPLIVASEYRRLTERWVARRGLTATLVRSFGATEVFPPEDADCIVDITASGATLRANHLVIVDELMTSSTCLYAHPRSLERPGSRLAIRRFVLLLRSVLEARQHVMLEVNVSAARLEAVVQVLPCMREATVAPLHAEEGFAVRAAVRREALPRLIPDIKERGGTDIVVTIPAQIVP